MPELGRLLTAMVTPYTPDGEVDYAHARRLASPLVRSGNDGVVSVGTTGESPLLTDDEKYRLWVEVKQDLGVRTVVAGAGTNDTRHSIHLARLADAGYIEIEKTFKGRIPLTMLRLTRDGKGAFDRYKKTLNGVLAKRG